MLLRQQNTTLRKTSETQTIEVRILASHAPALPKTSNVPGPNTHEKKHGARPVIHVVARLEFSLNRLNRSQDCTTFK